MRKLILVGMTALSLGACAEVKQLQTAYGLVTASVANPVTKDDLYKVESGVQIIFAVLNAYKKGCIYGSVDVNCKANIAKIQVYTRQLPPLLTQLRLFVKTNDQVNASVVYNNIMQLITQFKAVATANGINVGG